ncbi:MAG TPA: hypothetical protein DEQ40_08075 [Oxalobacteraceae bacterium]|nr:hypothetical protein [Oxalobacteraceae bacterium]
MQTNLKVRTGNRILVQFDGRTVGLVQSVRMNDDYAPEPASGIGDIHIQEWVPTQARHSLSVSAMVLNAGSLRAAGISMENGDAVLQGLVFEFVTQSKDDGSVLKKYIGCSYASGDVSVEKHAIVMNSAQFNCLDTVGTAI